MTSIAPSAAIGPDVSFGSGAIVGPFCVVGVDPDPSIAPAAIGSHARLRSHTVIYRGVCAGTAFSTGHGVLVRELTTIGDRVSIGSHSVVEHHVVLGHGVRLHSNCFVPELSVIEDDAWLGPNVVVTNARHPNRPETKANLEGVRIEHGAVIGAGAVLLPGVVVGANAMVGAGTVVVRDVADGTTVVGNPGRVVGSNL